MDHALDHTHFGMYDSDLLVTAVHVKVLKRRKLTCDFSIYLLLIGTYLFSLFQKMHS